MLSVLRRLLGREEHVVRVELPGFRRDEVRVNVRNGLLVVSAARGFRRRVVRRRLPRAAWDPAPKVKLRDGVLTIRLRRQRMPQGRLAFVD